MKLSLFFATLTLGLAAVRPHYGPASTAQWKPAGKNDLRGPCPMMNALANHGFLPRDGKNFTRDVVINGLSAGLNFNASLGSLMFDMALIANPEPNATFFTLDHLNRHNVLEHDASMSRSDAFFGNNHVFNETVFNETRAYWTKPILDADMLANGKIAWQIESKAYNPTYTFTSMMEEFSLGEVAAPVVAFGDIQAGTVNRSLVEYFFENEPLPTELGWAKGKLISETDIFKMTSMIRNATSLITLSKSPQTSRHRDLHAGFH